MSYRRAAIALAIVCLAAGGVAYATIPDAGGVIRACYTPHVGPGNLRVIDTAKGQHCRANEHALNWNQAGLNGATGPTGPTGPSGPSGPAGTAGPTSLDEGPGFLVPGAPGAVFVSHTVVPAQAGLTIITAAVQVQDANATTGLLTRVGCTVRLNGVDLGAGYGLTVADNGGDLNHLDTTSVTFIRRLSLATNDVVAVNCLANGGDENEAGAITQLLLQRVDS